MTRKEDVNLGVRSSAVEYLTFVAAMGEGGANAVYADENIWLSQKMLAELYLVTVPAINQHLKRIFDDSELRADSVVFEKYRVVQDRLYEADFDCMLKQFSPGSGSDSGE